MTTTIADTKPSTSGPLGIEQRLDALDRTLLGVLPRSERLALVAQVETRVRELAGGDAATESGLEFATEPEIAAEAVTRRPTPIGPKRRSRLALSSGILGIVALVMLFAMPVTYILVAFIAENLGEVVSMSLLGLHVLTVAVGGLVALIMGIAGLVSLSRRKGRLVGHGWAITGLCTAPLPTLVGGLLVLVTGLSLFAVQSVTVQQSLVPPPTYSYPENQASPYPSGPAMPASFPMSQPRSQAPTLSVPCEACPQPGRMVPATTFNPYQGGQSGYEPAKLSLPPAPASQGSYGPSEPTSLQPALPATTLPVPPPTAPPAPASSADQPPMLR